MKKFFGKIIYGFGKGLASVLGAIISVLEWLIEGVRLIGRGVVAALFGLGCFIIWLSPLVLGAIFHPKVFPFVIAVLMIVVLGKPFVSALRYGAFVLTETIMDYGKYLGGERGAYKSFRDFSDDYKRMQYEEEREARRRAEEAKREQYRREQEAWEEMFRGFFGGAYDSRGGWSTGQNRAGSEGRSGAGSWGNGGYDFGMSPNAQFRAEYEKACDVLGVPYSADVYEIKLAFRKLAKKYHPDVNKEPGATERFQRINDAYMFLNDENIRRYKES